MILVMAAAGRDVELFELVLEPSTTRFGPLDDGWNEQVMLLLQDLQREVGGVTRRHERVEGAKGGADVIIMALGSAGAFTATLEMLRSWLGRDRTRKLNITYTLADRTETVSIAGDAIDKAGMTKITDAVAARLGNAPWTGTAPS